MKNIFIYISLLLAGISVPAILMYLGEGNISILMLGVYVFVYKPVLDKLRLDAKGVKSEKGSLWWKYPFWSYECLEKLYSK